MMSNNPSVAPKPTAHLKMLADMIERGFIKRVGDTYEITPAGHEYTMAQSAKLHAAVLE